MKPDVSSPYNSAKYINSTSSEEETLPVVQLIAKKPKKPKPAAKILNRSHSRRDCKACDDLHLMKIKANPMKNEY